MKPLLAIDFEYNGSNEPHMGLVSVDFCKEDGSQTSVWLLNDIAGKERAKRILERVREAYTLVAHNVIAEASCLLALGLNPRDFTWIDTMLEFKQLQNSNFKYMYGWSREKKHVFNKTGWIESKPPFPTATLHELDFMFGEEREKFFARIKNSKANHSIVAPNLANMLKNILGVEIDVERKDKTIALILEKKDQYSEEEKKIILDYGASDTEHLCAAARRMFSLVHERMQKAQPSCTVAQAEEAILWRGRAAANTAVYTMEGIPLSTFRWRNLTANKRHVITQAIDDFKSKHCSLWEWDRSSEKWAQKKTLTDAWVEGLIAKYSIAWPKTKDGHYSLSTADGQPLSEYRDSIPDVKDYCHLQELIKALGMHSTEEEAEERAAAGKASFQDFVGSDGRVRPYYGPYGTQTGRNAPKATSFIFAQAGWLRGLIEPPPGWVICERDFSSQEAFIAAVLSGDPQLMKAYMSGDPYLAFAISAGAAPKDATKKSHAEIRNLFKSTVLGLQYGMGAKKLAVKLTADTGKKVSEARAKELIDLHKQVYHIYYAWKDRVWENYRQPKPIILADGFYLDTHNSSKMSTLNFPIQGAGSAIMRVMIDELLSYGIHVVCPVHDSVVYLCKEEDEPQLSALVGECMLTACRKILRQEGMRVGKADVVANGEFWYTEKNQETLKTSKKYLDGSYKVEVVEDFLTRFLK